MGRLPIKAAPGYAWCSECQQERSIDQFWHEKGRWNGLHSKCKSCSKRMTQAWIKAHPDHQRGWLLKKYGMTLLDYKGLLAFQKGVCAICGLTQNGRGLFVDHDHATGEVRGLLCALCNQFLGRINDDPANLVAYLSPTRRVGKAHVGYGGGE